MIIHNRRDAGYTIISRFEEEFRILLTKKLSNLYKEYTEGIPAGILKKIKDKSHYEDDIINFFENTDFPDLKEITLYGNNYISILGKEVNKKEFTTNMDELYNLRCKIAHVKGYFTSIDLEKLVNISYNIAEILDLIDFKILIERIKSDPNSVTIKIPIDFLEDPYKNNGIINNIPIPDYEYEGGFVGREEDRKKIVQLLQSPKFPVVTLTGSGGVGKTSLALKILQDISEKNEHLSYDAIIWVSAKENLLTDIGIEEIEPTFRNYDDFLDTIIELFNFGDELADSSTEEKERVAGIIVEIATKILIVIDNLETVTDQRIVNFIFDAPLNIKFLITSRRGIGQLERRYELKEMVKKEAIYLFRQIAREKQLSSLASLPEDIIKNYVEKVSYYPLAIKWLVGQVARGKDINNVISSITIENSDISKFCYEQIFTSLSDSCKKIMYTIALLNATPTASIIKYVLDMDDQLFEDSIYELTLASLVIPEQFQNDRKEISTKYILLPLTKGYTRVRLNLEIEIREKLKNRINEVENTVSETERIKKEYKHSLYNFGAKTDEEKIAAIIAQTAFQKYQSGLYDDAVNEYKRAIKTAPTFSPIYRNWAMMESYENHIVEAERLMVKASELAANDPYVFLVWGNIYRKSNRLNEAYKKYTIAYQLDKEDPIILSAYGQSKSMNGDFEIAHDVLNKALNVPNDYQSLKHEIINRTSIAENLISWGDAFSRNKDYDNSSKKYQDSIENATIAVNLSSRDPQAYSVLSRAYLRFAQLHLKYNREKDDIIAVHYLNKVISLKFQNFKIATYRIQALVELMVYYFDKGDFQEVNNFLKIVDADYKNSAILKRSENRNLQDKIVKIKSDILSIGKDKGVIVTVNYDKGYVIIEDAQNCETYFGHVNSFIPKTTNITDDLQGIVVTYTQDVKKGRKEARNIIITKST